MSFGAPEWLWALLVLPALVAIFVRAERRSTARLAQFVAPRLLPQLGATVNRFRRVLRFSLLLLGLALALLALAQPRYGYTYKEVKRKGLDLIVAIDTSRSMLSNDVSPNRLERVKLSAQDLIGELRGDRVGLIAFAGQAFVQAPLTIDYDAAVEALNEFDTNIIPEGGTNISKAITLAVSTFGKSAIGNRALIIFTDGEDLDGESARVAKTAADAGVKIFTIGVGTPQGSLIPLPSQDGGSAFVKDPEGQVVKSKLNETRLREIAQATGGSYYPLGNGTATMRQLYESGLSKMQAGEIDTKMSRQPIERYQWPLGAALLAFAASLLMSERKRVRRRARAVVPKKARPAVAVAAVLLSAGSLHAEGPGLDEYRDGKYGEAYQQFQETLQQHPDARATDKIQFDAGAAAYKMKDYGKALQSFSQALLSPNQQLQSRSHYNLGNTLYERGEVQKAPKEKLQDWSNALQHYDQTLKLDPENKQAKENSEFVKKKIEDFKKQQEQKPPPTPTPSPSPNPQNKNDQDKNKDQKQDQSKDQDQKKDDQQKQDQSQQQQQKDQQQKDQKKDDQQKSGEQPSPSPSPGEEQQKPGGASPSPSPGSEQGQSPSPSPGEGKEPSPTPGENGVQATPSPTPGEGDQQGQEGSSPAPSATPLGTPNKNLSGEVKSADDKEKPQGEAQAAEEVTPPPDGQMSPEQAERLLQSMKDEEARVQLDERKKVRRVYKDW
ncbi:MAG: VWA domain-containing protein [Chthoniobacterales bacterium]